jgi:predicted nucleic acid-binding protein
VIGSLEPRRLRPCSAVPGGGRAWSVLDVTDATALAYARLRAALRRSGRPIPANDAWIAALALQHRLPILSRDEHFDAVAGVQRKGW